MSIEVRDICYRYPRATEPALEDITFSVGEGETVAIVGPNGSGKSTIGRLMKGLVFPTEGQVAVDGCDTRTETLQVRRLVGLVFQNPTSQIVNAVIEGEVAFGPENLGLPPAEIVQRTAEALRAVGLQGMEEVECQSLSMANKQRVAVASVIAMGPHYMILDEPTAWLEPATRRPLLEEVFRWAESHGVGMVLVTHRMDEAQLCSRIVGMLDGHVAVDGPAGEVLRDSEIRDRLSLEVPETLALAEDLRDLGLPVVPGSSIERLAASLADA